MSVRALLALILCLALAIAAVLWFSHREAPGDGPAPPGPLLGTFSEDTVREIEVTCSGDAVTLARDDRGRWRITRPFDADADPRRVDELLAALEGARIKKVIAEGTAGQEGYGLSPAACTIRLGFPSPTAAVTCRLGRASPIGTDRYAVGDDARVVLTDGSVFTSVSRGAESFREKRLVPVQPDAITRIVLERPDGRLVVARAGEGWRVEAPYPDAASPSACEGLAQAITTLELSVPDKVAAPAQAVSSRRLKLEVFTGEGVPSGVAYVASAGIDGKRLAWREGAARAGLVEESAVRQLEEPSASFRDLRIASFSTPDVRRVSIAQGGATLRIERADEGAAWLGSAGGTAFPVDGPRVLEFLDRMRALTASGLASSPPPTPETGTISIESASEDLARLTWGTNDTPAAGDRRDLWVTAATRPGVVFLTSAARLGSIPARPGDLAPRTPASGGP